MMVDTDAEAAPASSTQPSNVQKRKSSCDSESCSQPNLPVKHRRTRTAVNKAKTSEPGISVMSLENLQIHNKVDRILKMMVDSKTETQAIRLNISVVNEKVEGLEKTVNEMKEQFIAKAPPVNAESMLELIQADINSVKESLKITTVPAADLNSTPEVMMSMGEPPAEPNPAIISPVVHQVAAKDVIPNLEEKIEARKHAYYKYLHNRDRFDIHRGWRDKETPFIPPRFVPKKLTHGESAAEYTVRKNNKLKDMDAYMELLQIRRDTGKASFESIDSEVDNIISDAEITEDERKAVLEQYTSRVAAEESASHKLWKKGKKGVECLIDRCAQRIVAEEERTYTVVQKRRDRKPKRKKVNQKVQSTVHNSGRVSQVAVPPADFSVPPPYLPLNFQRNRTRKQK